MADDSNIAGFDGVKITDSDMANMFEQPEPIPEKTADGDPLIEIGDQQKEKEEPTEPTKIKVKDGEYTEDEIAEALEDRKNKTAWQKTNTEEAQKLAATRKAIEPVVKFVEKLRSDGELAAEIREEAVERFGAEFGEIIDAAIAFDEKEHPNPLATEHEATKAELAELKARIEGEKAINAELKELRTAHKITEEQALKVLEFAEQKFTETGQALTLEDAFKLQDYEVQKTKANEKPKPKIPDVPRKDQGAKDIKDKPAGSYEDISLEGYNVFS